MRNKILIAVIIAILAFVIVGAQSSAMAGGPPVPCKGQHCKPPPPPPPPCRGEHCKPKPKPTPVPVVVPEILPTGGCAGQIVVHNFSSDVVVELHAKNDFNKELPVPPGATMKATIPINQPITLVKWKPGKNAAIIADAWITSCDLGGDLEFFYNSNGSVAFWTPSGFMTTLPDW